MASMVDVARMAEVAVTTVSRVVNNDPTVRPHNREAVEKAMAELGYVPNEGARSLRSARTHTIGLSALDLSDPPSMHFIAGIEDIVRAKGYSLILCDSELNREVEAANLRRLCERRVEGLIVQPVGDECPELNLFVRAGIPIVAGLYADIGKLPSEAHDISTSLLCGMEAAVKHLALLGHQKIAFIVYAGMADKIRVEEFREVLEKNGLAYDPDLVILSDGTRRCVTDIAALLSRTPKPTAIISGANTLTPYIFGGISELGLAVPDDVSFITVGNTHWTEFHNPPLTCVAFDNTAWGQLKAEYLFALIENKDVSSVHQRYKEMVTSKLVVRASTAPPR